MALIVPQKFISICLLVKIPSKAGGIVIINYVLLGKRIRTLRQEQKLTQNQLEEKANLNEKYVSNIERATSIPSIETIASIADALNVPIDYLVYGRLSQKPTSPTVDKINNIVTAMPEKHRLFILDFLKIYNKNFKL